MDIRSTYQHDIINFHTHYGINQCIVPIKKLIMYLWKVNIFIRLTAATYKSRGIFFGSRPAKFPPTFAYVMQLRKVIIARIFKQFRHTHKQGITLYSPIMQTKFRYFENILDRISENNLQRKSSYSQFVSNDNTILFDMLCWYRKVTIKYLLFYFNIILYLQCND